MQKGLIMPTNKENVNSVTEPTSNEVSCIDCQSQIPTKAKKCVKCGAFQNRFKNHLTYFAQVTGFLTIIVSALVFLVNSTPELRKNISWKDTLKVLTLDESEVVFSDNGDGDLFIESIEIVRLTPANSSTLSFPINKLIRKGDILRHSLPEKPGDWKTVASEASSGTEEWNYFANQTVTKDSCYELRYYDSDNTQYKQVLAHYQINGQKGPMNLPHRAIVHAYSMKQQKMLSIPFGIVGLVVQIISRECEAASYPIQQTSKYDITDSNP